MFSNKIHALSLSLAVGLSFGVLQSESDARSIPGSIGYRADPADEHCFGLSGSSVTNNCPARKRIDFPLVIDAGGTISAQVRAEGATSANNVECDVTWNDASISQGSASVALPGFGSPRFINISVSGAFSTDSVYVGCWINQGGWVHTVIY